MSSNRKQKKMQKMQEGKLLELVPYRFAYDEGIIETDGNMYSKAYQIMDAAYQDLRSYTSEMIMESFEKLLISLPNDFSMQFVIHNKLIAKNQFLMKIIRKEDKEDKVNGWINKYNQMICENSEIGHNNVRKDKYFVISVDADSIDDAIERFEMEEEHIVRLFKDICNISIRELSIIERIKILGTIYNPREGERVDICKEFDSLSEMRRKKITTKSLVKPTSVDNSALNYLVLNNGTYVRCFFITSLPSKVSNNLISDITNISSNMIFSAFYEPVDASVARFVTNDKVQDNTIVRQEYIRETIRDRKNHTIAKTEQMLEHDEEAYFCKTAATQIREEDKKVMLCTFCVALFADDLETLERDSKLLHISTSKFACQVKPLDLQQIEGLKSVLPLANTHIDCKRLLTTKKLSMIPPLNLQEVLQRDGVFNGLNSINDNLILLNRKNNPTLAGIIAGTEHSGKTFQCKREIYNALISTNDRVIILSNTDEYDDFVLALGGEIEEKLATKPFYIPSHYGLMNSDQYSKSLFLEALFRNLVKNDEYKEANRISSVREGEDSPVFEIDEKIMYEVKILLSKITSLKRTSSKEIIEYIKGNFDFDLLSQGAQELEKILKTYNGELSDNRLFLIKAKSSVEMLLALDHLFAYQLSQKEESKTCWLFIDSFDEIFSTEQGAGFLLDYVEKMNRLQNVFTMVIQSSVKLFTENATSFRLTDLINASGYYKLLNQAAIERKKYTDILNIPSALVNYITSAELGKGIILTPASNVAFDDNFALETEDDVTAKFYELFKI